MNGDAAKQVERRPHRKFKWAPNFADVREAVERAGSGDGWAVQEGMVRYISPFLVITHELTPNLSVTPLKANFWHVPGYQGEIKL